jgi:hypothetical protein
MGMVKKVIGIEHGVIFVFGVGDLHVWGSSVTTMPLLDIKLESKAGESPLYAGCLLIRQQ